MKNIILAAVIGLIFVGSANAQQVITTSDSQALAIASAGGGGGVTEFSGRYTINNVPGMGSMAVALANNCAMVHGGQAVVAGFGLGGQATTESDECNRRATAAAYWAMGDHAMAREIMAESAFATRARQRLNERANQTQQAQMVSVRASTTSVTPVVVAPTGCPVGTSPLPAPYSHVCR